VNMPNLARFPKVERLLHLLGADEARGRTPVLLAVNARQKAPSSAGWSERSWSDMLDEGYLSTLEVSPNIGVLLGPKSGGLVTVDLDDDAHVEAFLDLNPPLRNTLRTRGARGCQLWLWMAPDERFQKLGIPSWPQGCSSSAWPTRATPSANGGGALANRLSPASIRPGTHTRCR
jgi:hypothetical protein